MVFGFRTTNTINMALTKRGAFSHIKGEHAIKYTNVMWENAVIEIPHATKDVKKFISQDKRREPF